MSAMKDLLMDILEMLEKTGMDYEKVAEAFHMSPKEVFNLAKEYGDL